MEFSGSNPRGQEDVKQEILRSEDVGSDSDSPMFNLIRCLPLRLSCLLGICFRFRKQRFRRVWIFNRRWSSSPVAVMRSH